MKVASPPEPESTWLEASYMPALKPSANSGSPTDSEAKRANLSRMVWRLLVEIKAIVWCYSLKVKFKTVILFAPSYRWTNLRGYPRVGKLVPMEHTTRRGFFACLAGLVVGRTMRPHAWNGCDAQHAR